MSGSADDEKAAGGPQEPNTRASATSQLPRRWSDDPWCNMTTGEADAYRRGWEAAKAQAEAVARPPQGRLMAAQDYDAREMVADAILAMGPPK